MKTISLSWKNFNSYGNRTQTIEIPNESGFFLVSGQNGAGKTTIREVLEFLLYGKVSGKKLSDLPNRINKNLWAKGTFVSKNKTITIEAGLAPSFVNLWVDGVQYKKAGKRGPREYLLEELLEFPSHVFSSIISISINDFKSFLKMNPDDKRKIVDKIFGFQIINAMRENLKKRSKELSDSLAISIRQMENSKHSLDHSLLELENLNKKMEEMSVDAINEAKVTVDKFTKTLEYHRGLVAEFTTREREYKKNLQDLNNMVLTSRNEINKIAKDLELYEKDKCPTCKSDLTTDFHQTQKLEMSVEIEKMRESLDKKELEYTDAKKKESEYDLEKRTFIEKESKIKYSINAWTEKLKALESGTHVDQQALSIKNIIQKMEDQLKESEISKNKTSEYLTWNNIVEEALGEKGIKQLAIRTILPALNAEIGKLMNDMHLDYKVTFDEEFNATVKHFGEEISIVSLSRGEMKKVDFVVLISIIRLMKMRFPTINMLFLDEILDGLDGENIYLVIKVLSKSLRDLNLNTFIISFGHSLEDIESFDYKILVEKQNNFSNLKIEKNK